MSFADKTPAPPDPKLTATMTPFVDRRFSRAGGLADASKAFDEEMRLLLRPRLRAAASVGAGAVFAFIVRDLIVGQPAILLTWPILGVQIAVVVICAILFIWLTLHRSTSLSQLRVAETVLFGTISVYLLWFYYYWRINGTGADLSPPSAFAAETAISWVLMIGIYGLVIPNGWKRASVLIGIMALGPFITVCAAAVHDHELATVLYSDGYLSVMGIWVGVGASMAVLGSHRYGALRREAFDARKLGAYTLREKLGAGGMGDVYLAEHDLLKRPCALKLIKPEKDGDARAQARFSSEVQAAARLTHPNTIEIFDYGCTEDGTFFYVMEYLPGLNLQEIVDRNGPLPPERVVHLLRQVCSALGEAHAAGLVHRDIKPGNIFVAERGGLYDVIKVLDFGLVKTIAPDAETLKLTLDGLVVGSPLFTSPEVVGEKAIDARSDLYSLGAVAYFLLCGRPVFSGSTPLKIVFAHATEIPAAPSNFMADIPADLESVVMRCLEKQPDDRFHDVGQLEDALIRCTAADSWTRQQASDWWLQGRVLDWSETAVDPDGETQPMIR